MTCEFPSSPSRIAAPPTTTSCGMARLAEDGGFEGFLRADHYQSMGADPGLPGPTDAWITLAGLARETSRIRLGTLVTSATFRLPGPLAVIVAQVDQMSGGRVDLGIGAGWYEREHTLVRHPVPAGRRTLRPAGRATRRGHRPLADAARRAVQPPGRALPAGRRARPAQAGPGARSADHRRRQGPKRTPELAARYADEFNMPFKTVKETAEAYERVLAACDRVDRAANGLDPLVLSAGIVVAIGRNDAEAQRRAAPLHVKSALPPEDPVIGSPAQLVERIGEFAAIGAGRVHLRLIDLTDLDHLELIAAEVLPQLGGIAMTRQPK